ncbi:MAG: glycosyltransferase family 9 protein [Elusimicrobiota bacterium]|nr:glycosyltransferase family 9 protein [Elusimicrobiota bacterium]
MAHDILVIRLSSLGDVALTGPVYRNLKAHWPDARVTVLVKPAFAAVLTGHPDIDEVLPFTGLLDALRVIRARRFTHLLDLHATFRTWLLRTLARVPLTTVYRKDALARRLFVAFGVSTPALQRHVAERYLDALAAWGVPTPARSVSSAHWRGAPDKTPARRVLVVQSAFLGDSLLTVPLLRRLRELLPGTRLSVLTLPGTVEIFKGPWVDEVLVDDKRGADGGLLGPWRVAARLKAERFDLAVIPHRSLRSALVAKLAGIPRRVGFSTSAGRFLLTDTVPFTWLMHDLERNLALLLPLGGGAAPERGESRYLDAPPMTKSLAQRLLDAGVDPGARLAGVHPGAAWATKRWLPERYAALCAALRGEGLVPVLVGGPADAALAKGIAEAGGAADLTGKTDLADLKALMGRLSLFVTNDSGPMHLAAAAGVPVVAVFGATTRELGFFPYGPGHRVVEAELACRPCGLHGGRDCPEGHFLCMKLVTVPQVLAACREALAAVAAR